MVSRFKKCLMVSHNDHGEGQSVLRILRRAAGFKGLYVTGSAEHGEAQEEPPQYNEAEYAIQSQHIFRQTELELV